MESDAKHQSRGRSICEGTSLLQQPFPSFQHPANRSALISEDDVVIKNIQIESDLRGIIIERDQLVGKVAVRDLIAGQPLRQSDVKAPDNQQRPICYHHIFAGGLTVTMKGKALGNARAGDRIWVQNQSSNKRVEGSYP